MANLNQVTLVGYLSRDPELRWTPSGTPVVLLGLVGALLWMRLLKVGAQSALLLAPAAAALALFCRLLGAG